MNIACCGSSCPYLPSRSSSVGTIWRYRYDKFGWTTRSSQLYESAILRWGSPLFHFGILLVLVGHVGGLLIPKSWTEAVGITDHAYHLAAVFLGTVAGLLHADRHGHPDRPPPAERPGVRRHHPQRQGHVPGPRAVIVLGLWPRSGPTSSATATTTGRPSRPGSGRCSSCSPDPELMAGVPLGFQAHICRRVRCCSRSGRSPGWSTRSARRSATSPARTSSTAAAIRPACARSRHRRLGGPAHETASRRPRESPRPKAATTHPAGRRHPRPGPGHPRLPVNFWAWALIGPLAPGLKERLGLSFAAAVAAGRGAGRWSARSAGSRSGRSPTATAPGSCSRRSASPPSCRCWR